MTGDQSALRLLGSGRSADVFEIDEERVLRRYRPRAATPYHAQLARQADREAEVMTHAREHGFPVPLVHDANATDIIMERVDGATMLGDLVRRPWMLLAHARTLADLHDRLHAIPAPDWLTNSVGVGSSLLHMDLHPENVILRASGPVVIDWANAGSGPAALDVAHTWVVMASAMPESGALTRGIVTFGRRLFVRAFLRHFDGEEIANHVPAAVERWLADRNVNERERRRAAQLFDLGPRCP